MEVLLIDDDIELSSLLQQQMALYSINLIPCHTPSRALVLLHQQTFDVILLDIMLPEMSGFELCHRLRGELHQNQKTPLIMLTARNETVDMIAGLESGADDYVSKPFEPRELIARIVAVQRRNRANAPAAISSVPETVILGQHWLSLSLSQAWVTVNNLPLRLTSTEMHILAQLIRTPGKIFLRSEFDTPLLPNQHQIPRSIDALIYRMRSKIRDITGDEDFIYTVRAHGYMLRGVRCTAETKQRTEFND
ncbi:MAG: Transcriptional regulatory protein OmpR [Candidatus Erwinia impunctatus]